MRRWMRARWAQGLLICCLMVVMMGANDPSARYNRLGHEMVCTCGCGEILLECNHVGCPNSGPMIDELRTKLASGDTDTSILNWFAAKYGATVLAAPIRGGFDDVAWILPAVVFFLATIGTALVVRLWKRRNASQTPLAAAGNTVIVSDALRERIRRETEY